MIKWLVGLALLGGAGYAGYTYWAKPAKAPVQYQSTPVARGDIVQSVTANGSLTPIRLVDVGSQISGMITDIKADFNSLVKAGEVVAQIDPASYQRTLGEADAQLANAVASEELAELEFKRAEELLAANLISKSDYDTRRVALSQAKAMVKTREANVERAKVDLERTTIAAPMDGVVIARKVEIGQTVAAAMNAPVLFQIANDLAKMRIEAAVSEADVGGVEDGQQVQFTVDAFPGRQFAGQIVQVRYAPTTNQGVITYTTVVEVENKDLKLRPGMTANARIITAERKGVLRLPNAALRFRPPADALIVGDAGGSSSGPAVTKVELIESGPFEGLPVMPWMAGGERRRPTEEERTAYAASLTPEQKQKYDRVTAEMRARFTQGGGGGGGGGFGGGAGGGGGGFGGGGGGGERRRTDSGGPRSVTVYLLDQGSAEAGAGPVALRPVSVKVGISDATHTEVLEGLKDGDVVVTGAVVQETATATAVRNPLGSPFGGGRPRGR
ncbi:MAG: efflux RND transporter periplasmic adaptor subunit [Limisphaerales bacterium]